uniref:TNFAIP3-interacting protein 2 n=1 Tax=Pristiophorus japonicus TaxID=55135 RepID=UPI00398EA296
MSVDDESAGRLVVNFSQLQDLVDTLQKDNRVLTTKLKSYSTIATFYHESRQELAGLRRQIAQKDGLARQLQARLAAYQGSAARLGAEPAAGLGPAGSLLDSLLQEVTRAKKELADSARDWQREKDQLKEDLQTVELRLREKEHEVEQMVGSSQHQKDGEIARLRRALGEKDRLHATRELWCRSLADEAEQLQLRLAGTADMCQQLARQLEEQRARGAGHGTEQEPIPPEQGAERLQADSPETNACKLLEENQTLKQKVVYVEDLNAKWQNYDVSREEYVKRLHQQLKELRSRAEQPTGFGLPQAGADILRQEILRLNRLLEEKMKDCGRLAGYRDGLEQARAAAQQLREELEAARVAGGAVRERMQMLEQQVLVYKDDFKSEREDRERAQSRIQELEEELASLRLQLPRKQEHRDPAGRLHGNAKAHYREPEMAEPLLGNGTEPPSTHRGSSSPSPETPRPILPGSSPGPEPRQQGFLQCPKCMRLFNDEVSNECLRHISECCQ